MCQGDLRFAEVIGVYWGASDDVLADAVRAGYPQRRLRRLGVALAVTLLSLGGTVAMASATTSHANAATTAPAVNAVPGAPTPIVRFHLPRPPAPEPAPTTTVAPKRAAAPVTRPAPVPEQQAVATAEHTRSTTPAAAPLAGADTCAAAIAYLGAHAAPGFTFECPGYSLGHQAMTCVNVAGVCPGVKLITISVVCPASYMNEAHNSWILAGLATGSIDPYGYCH